MRPEAGLERDHHAGCYPLELPVAQGKFHRGFFTLPIVGIIADDAVTTEQKPPEALLPHSCQFRCKRCRSLPVMAATRNQTQGQFPSEKRVPSEKRSIPANGRCRFERRATACRTERKAVPLRQNLIRVIRGRSAHFASVVGRNFGSRRAFVRASKSAASASSFASLQARPKNDTPTGSSATWPAGTVTLG